MFTAATLEGTQAIPTRDEFAEVLMLEHDGVWNSRLSEPFVEERQAGQLSEDDRVTQLATLACVDSDELMKSLQDELKHGNRQLALTLAAATCDFRFEPEARGLLLETLAAARVRWFEPETMELVRNAIESPDSELQFAAIAAASDLSRPNQAAISRVISNLLLIEPVEGDVRQAAEAFLRRVNGSSVRSHV